MYVPGDHRHCSGVPVLSNGTTGTTTVCTYEVYRRIDRDQPEAELILLPKTHAFNAMPWKERHFKKAPTRGGSYM